VRIPGCAGPDEGDGPETIEFDFGLVFDCNQSGQVDAAEIQSEDRQYKLDSRRRSGNSG